MSTSMSTPVCAVAPAGRLPHVVAALFLVALAGCGGGGGGGGGGDAAPAPPTDPGVAGAPYFTFAVGDRWRSRSDGVVETTRVISSDASGLLLRTEGPTGFVDEQRLVVSAAGVRSVPVAGSDALTVAVGAYDIVRFPLRTGTSFTAVDKAIDGQFDFNGDGRADNLRVLVEIRVVGFERVTVPAGSFDNALRQRTTITQTVNLAGSPTPIRVVATSDDWYALGVGPVRNQTVITSDGSSESSEEQLLEYRVGTLRSDTVAPVVASRTPAAGSLGRSARVELVFSEDIERSPGAEPVLAVFDAAGAPIAGSSAWSNARTLSFMPTALDALANGRFEARLQGVAEDWAGNRLEGPVSWRFDVDSRGPTLLSQSPAPNATEVPVNAALSFTFDEPLDPAMANPARVTMFGPAGATVAVAVAVDGAVLRVTPTSPLRGGETYTVLLNSIVDVLGNGPAFTDSTRFTTTRGEPGRFDFPVELAALAGSFSGANSLGDVDADGRRDLLTGLTLVRGAAGGGLGATAETLPDAAGCRPGSTELVDLDADGRLDVLGTASFCGTFWLKQLPGGGWQDQGRVAPFANQARPIRLAGQARPGILTVGNFDFDLVLVRPAGGPGSTGFLPNEIIRAGTGQGRQLHVTDLDGDGREDIVMKQDGGSRIWVARQRVDAGFDLTSLDVDDAFDVLLVADLDGDGRQDLLVALNPPLGTALRLLPQAADGSFTLPGRRIVLPAATSDAFHADLNGDGRRELVLTTLDSGAIVNLAVVALRPDGSVGYEPLLQYPTLPIWSISGAGLDGFSFGDFNNDGLVDILHRSWLVTGRTPLVLPAASDARPLALPGLLGRGRLQAR